MLFLARAAELYDASGLQATTMQRAPGCPDQYVRQRGAAGHCSKGADT